MIPGLTPTRRRIKFGGIVSRRRDSDAEGEWFVLLGIWPSDRFGDAVEALIWNVDEDERERVTRGGNPMD
jgi:hypothetical protein